MFRGCLTSFLRCPIIGIKDQGQGDCAAPVKLHTPSFAFPFLPAACPFSPFTVHKEHPTLLSLGKWQHLFDLNRSGEDNEDLHWLFLFYACLMTTYFALAGPGFQPIIICPGFHSYAAGYRSHNPMRSWGITSHSSTFVTGSTWRYTRNMGLLHPDVIALTASILGEQKHWNAIHYVDIMFFSRFLATNLPIIWNFGEMLLCMKLPMIYSWKTLENNASISLGNLFMLI